MKFLELPAALTAYESAAYVVLPIPYDATASYRGGARLGPAAILDASQQVENFDEEMLLDPTGAGIYTAEAARPNVAGPREMARQVEGLARPILADGKFLLALGGEHSVTYGLVKAVLSERCSAAPGRAAARRPAKPPLGVLQVDAHADLRDEYEGSAYSHACVMRRLREEFNLAAVGVGVRNFSQEEHEYMLERRIEPMTPARIAAEPKRWIGRVLDQLPRRIYLTIDIDGLDPSIAPGTGTPEPGGLTWAQVTALLRAAFQHKQVVAADIVEVSPIPGQHVTEFLAARLAHKMIAYRQALSPKARR